jgi:hypothetical protein
MNMRKVVDVLVITVVAGSAVALVGAGVYAAKADPVPLDVQSCQAWTTHENTSDWDFYENLAAHAPIHTRVWAAEQQVRATVYRDGVQVRNFYPDALYYACRDLGVHWPGVVLSDGSQPDGA